MEVDAKFQTKKAKPGRDVSGLRDAKQVQWDIWLPNSLLSVRGTREWPDARKGPPLFICQHLHVSTRVCPEFHHFPSPYR